MQNNLFKNPRIMRFLTINVFQIAIVYFTFLILTLTGIIDKFLSIDKQIAIVVFSYVISFLLSKYTVILFDEENKKKAKIKIIESKLFAQEDVSLYTPPKSSSYDPISNEKAEASHDIEELNKEIKELKKRIKVLQATPMNWKGSFISYNILMTEIINKIYCENASREELKIIYNQFEAKMIAEYDDKKYGKLVADSITQSWGHFPEILKYRSGKKPPKKAKTKYKS